VRGTSCLGRLARRLTGLSGSVTSYSRGRHHCRSVVRVPGCRVGADGVRRGDCVYLRRCGFRRHSTSASFDGVSGVVIRPKTALGCRCCGFGPISTILMLGGGRVRVMRERCRPTVALRPLVCGGTLHLLCRRHFEQCLELFTHLSLVGGRRLRAAAQKYGFYN
jgi:hypothetical protein